MAAITQCNNPGCNPKIYMEANTLHYFTVECLNCCLATRPNLEPDDAIRLWNRALKHYT